jgi:predicted PurR-regulated permease PerM
MWWPFLKLFFMALILTILFLPVYEKLVKNLRSETAAAFLTILAILGIVIIPLYFIGQILFNELLGLYNSFREGGITFDKNQIISQLPPQLQSFVNSFFSDFSQRLSAFAANAFASVTDILSNVAGFVLSFFLVFFAVYYMLRDGKTIKSYINSILPLSESHENILVTKLSDAISGVVKGSFLVALIQGTVATIGFLIFGVPSAFLWGAFTVLAALVPNVGTSLSIVPAVVYLLIADRTGAAIGLAIWGAVAVGLVDNVVSPKLIGSRTNLHPLIVLFSVLGGLQLFGLLGFLLGPILAAVFVALLDIYRTDLKQYFAK